MQKYEYREREFLDAVKQLGVKQEKYYTTSKNK